MKDRVSLYPGRVTLTPVAGQQNTYDMERADQPTQVGTPLNTNTLLKDSTAALYGLVTNATPDDVFQAAVEIFPKIVFEDFFTTQGPTKIKDSIPELSIARAEVSAANNGSYALVAGSTSYSASVDAYNSSFVRSSATSLSVGRGYITGESLSSNNIAIFAGGFSGSFRNEVDAYNSGLVHSTPTDLSIARRKSASAVVNNIAVFAGGRASSSSNQDAVDSYKGASLIHNTPDSLSESREGLSGAGTSKYAVFGGGTGYSATVDAYSSSLIHSSPQDLSVGRHLLAAAETKNHAVFVGGLTSGSSADTTGAVDAYDANLIHSTPQASTISRSTLCGVALNNGLALFGGGKSGTVTFPDVQICNQNLIFSDVEDLSIPRYALAATSLGGITFFFGGRNEENSASSAVDAYNSSGTYTLAIPPMSAYMFDGITDEETVTFSGTTLSGTGTLNGYIKPTGFTLSGYYPQG